MNKPHGLFARFDRFGWIHDFSRKFSEHSLFGPTIRLCEVKECRRIQWSGGMNTHLEGTPKEIAESFFEVLEATRIQLLVEKRRYYDLQDLVYG